MRDFLVVYAHPARHLNPPMSTSYTAERLAAAHDFHAFVASAQKNQELWSTIYRTAVVPEGAVERAEKIPGLWHLLVLTEDWCGDAVNVIPVLAKLAERVPSLDLKLLGRDANPDIMDAHLTGTARSIPVVIVLDEQLREHGWWGPRPTALQAWFEATGRGMEKTERYKQIRTWFARDRGRSTVDEVLQIVERAARVGGERPIVTTDEHVASRTNSTS